MKIANDKRKSIQQFDSNEMVLIELFLEEALDNLKKGTRHYAKRQLSWFRRIPYAHTLYVDDYADVSGLADAVVSVWMKK